MTTPTEKEFSPEEFVQYIDQLMGAYSEPAAAAMLAEYLRDNGDTYTDEEIKDYVFRTGVCHGIGDAAYILGIDDDAAKDITWDNLLDRDDVEYIDYADPETQIIIYDP